MEQAQEILGIIEQGFNINAPSDTIISVIKNYCESVINYNKSKKGEKND